MELHLTELLWLAFDREWIRFLLLVLPLIHVARRVVFEQTELSLRLCRGCQASRVVGEIDRTRLSLRALSDLLHPSGKQVFELLHVVVFVFVLAALVSREAIALPGLHRRTEVLAWKLILMTGVLVASGGVLAGCAHVRQYAVETTDNVIWVGWQWPASGLGVGRLWLHRHHCHHLL